MFLQLIESSLQMSMAPIARSVGLLSSVITHKSESTLHCNVGLPIVVRAVSSVSQEQHHHSEMCRFLASFTWKHSIGSHPKSEPSIPTQLLVA